MVNINNSVQKANWKICIVYHFFGLYTIYLALIFVKNNNNNNNNKIWGQQTWQEINKVG